MSYISFAQAKQLTLDRLNTVMREMPVNERGMPRYILGDPITGRTISLSILSLITEVERETPLGRSYVGSEVQGLGYAIR